MMKDFSIYKGLSVLIAIISVILFIFCFPKPEKKLKTYFKGKKIVLVAKIYFEEFRPKIAPAYRYRFSYKNIIFEGKSFSLKVDLQKYTMLNRKIFIALDADNPAKSMILASKKDFDFFDLILTDSLLNITKTENLFFIEN